MFLRLALLALCIYPLWKLIEVTGLVDGYSKGTSNSVVSSLSNESDIEQELGLYTNVEVDQVKKELNAYVADKSLEYRQELSEINTLLANKQFEEANQLLRSTRQQYPNQPALLARHAETIALMNNGKFTGEPFDLLGRALDIDIKHKPSLWMMALVNQQMGNHKAAVILLKLLKREMSPSSGSIETINSAMARSMVEIENQSETESVQVAKPQAIVPKGTSISAPSINLYVTLEPEIVNTFSPEDTVFIYARATGQKSMPLAVARRQVSDFPTTVTLDNSMAMMPAQNLSSSKLVTVGARASRSGTAMPLTGDWEVELYDVPIETKELIPLNIHYELK